MKRARTYTEKSQRRQLLIRRRAEFVARHECTKYLDAELQRITAEMLEIELRTERRKAA